MFAGRSYYNGANIRRVKRAEYKSFLVLFFKKERPAASNYFIAIAVPSWSFATP